MVTIPAKVRRELGIRPGWRLDWQPVEGKEEILVRVFPDRGELARRLLGAGRKFLPDRDAVSELVAERDAEVTKRLNELFADSEVVQEQARGTSELDAVGTDWSNERW